MRGRKPKPTELKEILGNPGHRPLNQNEPKVEGPPQRPRYLKGKEKELFDTRAAQMPWLKSIDSETLGRWAVLEARFQKDPRAMTASMLARIDSLEARLGMDPSSRSRMSVGTFERPTEVPEEHDGGAEAKDGTEKYFGPRIN